MSRSVAVLHRGPTRAGQRPAEPAAGVQLIDLWLAGRAPSTARVYRAAAAQFSAWLGSTLDDLPTRLCTLGRGPVTADLLAYRQYLMERGLAVATRALATAAVASLVNRLRLFGLLDWHLELPRERIVPYRDTRGPSLPEVRGLLAAADRSGLCRGPRDRALICLAWGELLRRAELTSLDLAHVERGPDGPTVIWIQGKGERARRRVTLCGASRRALAEWLAVRGDAAGPLFTGPGGRRLTGRGFAKRLARLAALAGVPPVRPHGLRHAGITAALDAGLDVRAVRQRSRHARLETLLLYDDARTDPGLGTGETLGYLLMRGSAGRASP